MNAWQYEIEYGDALTNRTISGSSKRYSTYVHRYNE